MIFGSPTISNDSISPRACVGVLQVAGEDRDELHAADAGDRLHERRLDEGVLLAVEEVEERGEDALLADQAERLHRVDAQVAGR
jgi:hypothetical protein